MAVAWMNIAFSGSAAQAPPPVLTVPSNVEVSPPLRPVDRCSSVEFMTSQSCRSLLALRANTWPSAHSDDPLTPTQKIPKSPTARELCMPHSPLTITTASSAHGGTDSVPEAFTVATVETLHPIA